MAASLEMYIAIDVGVQVRGKAACTHGAYAYNPLALCSMTFNAIKKFAPVAADGLKVLPAHIEKHDDVDYDLIASKMTAIKQITRKKFQRPLYLYAFAVAKRLEIPIIARRGDPSLQMYQALGNVFRVRVLQV